MKGLQRHRMCSLAPMNPSIVMPITVDVDRRVTDNEFADLDAWVRAANFLTAGQIYLLGTCQQL